MSGERKAPGRCFLCVCAEVLFLQLAVRTGPLSLPLFMSPHLSVHLSIPSSLCLGVQQWRETSAATR